MGQAPVSGVKRVGKSGDVDDAIPGQLSRDDKGQWDFTGNGAVTPNQVTQRILDLESNQYNGAKEGLPSSLPSSMLNSVAQDLLSKNPKLDQDPSKAIPTGEKFSANVADLKNAIAPFLKDPALMKHLSTPNTSTTKFGDVPSHGLSLPYEHT